MTTQTLLTPDEIAKARKSPADLMQVIDPSYMRAEHIDLLNDYLMRAERREIRRLMVFMPPQHGKSTTTSKGFASHWIGTFPDEPVILASYGADWAEHWGRQVRGVITEYGEEIWGISVKKDSKAAGRWEIDDHKGGMTAVGIGGATTGRGAGLFLMDDVVKDQEEARSAVIQQRNIDWYQTVVKTRVAQNGVIVLIITRWHQNDLAGFLLRTEGHAWTVLSLPALAEANDPLNRNIGEALWPEKYSTDYLNEIRYGAIDPETGQRKGGTTAYWFNAMYQQRPTEEEGGKIKRHWWGRYDLGSVQFTSGYNAIDTAGYDATKKSGDPCVIHSAGRAGSSVYSTNLQKGYWEAPELLQRAKNAYLENHWPVLVEDVPWARTIMQMLRVQGIPVIPFSPGGHSKEARIDSVAPSIEAGHWYLPIGVSWVDDLIEEAASFPNGAHDDQVDTVSMLGIRHFLNGRMPTMAQRDMPRRRQAVQAGWRSA